MGPWVQSFIWGRGEQERKEREVKKHMEKEKEKVGDYNSPTFQGIQIR